MEPFTLRQQLTQAIEVAAYWNDRYANAQAAFNTRFAGKPPSNEMYNAMDQLLVERISYENAQANLKRLQALADAETVAAANDQAELNIAIAQGAVTDPVVLQEAYLANRSSWEAEAVEAANAKALEAELAAINARAEALAQAEAEAIAAFNAAQDAERARLAAIEAARIAAETADRRERALAEAEAARVAAEAEAARLAAQEQARLAEQAEAARIAAEAEAARAAERIAAEAEAARIAAEQAELARLDAVLRQAIETYNAQVLVASQAAATGVDVSRGIDATSVVTAPAAPSDTVSTAPDKYDFSNWVANQVSSGDTRQDAKTLYQTFIDMFTSGQNLPVKNLQEVLLNLRMGDLSAAVILSKFVYDNLSNAEVRSEFIKAYSGYGASVDDLNVYVDYFLNYIGPDVTAPVVTAPVVTAPVVTAPIVTQPIVTQPAAGGGAVLLLALASYYFLGA